MGLALFSALLAACAMPGPLAQGAGGMPPLRFVVEAPEALAIASPVPLVPSAGPGGGPGPAGGEAPAVGLPQPGLASSGPGGGGGGGGGGLAASADPITPTPNPASPTPTPDPSQPPDCAGPCLFGPRQGQAVDPSGAAIAQASFWVGGQEVVADAQGRATLPAPSSATEAVVVKAPGRLTSVLSGWHEGALTVHLQPAPDAGNAFPSQSSFEVTGRVLGVDGQPLAGASVVLASATGANGGPATTDAQGRYRVTLSQVPDDTAAQVVVWAYQSGAAGATTSLGHARIASVQGGQHLGDVRLQSPDGTTRLSAPLVPPFYAQATWRLWAIDPTGPRLAFASPALGRQEALAFLLPGCQLEFEAQAQGHQTVSVVRQRLMSAEGSVVANFLRPPEPQGALPWQVGAQWLWRPIPEAQAYRVEASSWEGASALPRWRLPEQLGAAPEAVRLVATTEGPLRSLAQVGPGPRALRTFEEPERWSAWEGPVQP